MKIWLERLTEVKLVRDEIGKKLGLDKVDHIRTKFHLLLDKIIEEAGEAKQALDKHGIDSEQFLEELADLDLARDTLFFSEATYNYVERYATVYAAKNKRVGEFKEFYILPIDENGERICDVCVLPNDTEE